MFHPLCGECLNIDVCSDRCAGLKKLSTKDKNRVWFWNKTGSYCRICGYDKSIRALHLHHLDKNQKDNNKDCLSVWLTKPLKYIIKKCVQSRFIILCANCHAEVHAGLIKIDDDYPGDNKLKINDPQTINLERILKSIGGT